MIKFYNNVDISGSRLLLSFNSEGLAGNFASSLLINNNSFSNVGFMFSEYILPYASIKEDGVTGYNGEVYFNSTSRIVLINFFAGALHYFRNKFFSELVELCRTYSFDGIYFYGGISKQYVSDIDIRSKFIDVYYLTNDLNLSTRDTGMKNFEDLTRMENKKKNFEELKFIEKGGLCKHLVKFLAKNNVRFYYLFDFAGELFDPLAGFALYQKLLVLFNLTKENIRVEKSYEDMYTILNKLSALYKIESTWKLFLKE